MRSQTRRPPLQSTIRVGKGQEQFFILQLPQSPGSSAYQRNPFPSFPKRTDPAMAGQLFEPPHTPEESDSPVLSALTAKILAGVLTLIQHVPDMVGEEFPHSPEPS